jgi:hypothetical protein
MKNKGKKLSSGKQPDLDKTRKDRDVSEIKMISDMQDKVFEHTAEDPEIRQNLDQEARC